MPRAARVLVLVAGMGVGVAMSPSVVGASVPPTTPPVSATTPGATATTLPGVVTATATTLPPAGTRGGATQGSVAKPESETWSPRRIATMTIIAVVALAAIGYAYGRLRSAPPRHPDLARRAPNVDTDALEARN